MLVKNWMTEGSINLGLESSVIDAAEIMRRNKIRQLPVIDSQGMIAGIVSDRDVRDALPSKYIPGDSAIDPSASLITLKAKDIMSIDPVVISPEDTVETAAELLMENKIGGLPVVDTNNKLIGIITEYDVFRFLCSVTGVTQNGIQLIFELEDTPGAAINLLSYLKDEEIRLTSVLTSYENVPVGHRRVSIRVQSTGKHSMESLANLLQNKFSLKYYVHSGTANAVN